MATASIDLSALVQDTATVGLGAYTGNPGITKSVKLSASDVTKVYTVARSVSSPDTFDVTTGLTNAYGAALVYTSVKAVVVLNTHTTATITVGGGSNPLFGSDQYTVKPGQVLYVSAVPATVDGTHKVLTVTPSAAVTYQLLILGA
jgi:hypothetical protein